MTQSISGPRSFTRTARNLLAIAVCGVIGGAGGIASAQTYDPVIFSFATFGDSRTDPNSPDPTTLLANPSPTTQGGAPSLSGKILPQDNIWVQNTQALATILANVQAQAPNMLFFNGDMVFGYGRPVVPSIWSTNSAPVQPNAWSTPLTAANIGQSSGLGITPDFVFELQQYAYFRGMIAPLFLTGTYVMPVPGNHETQCSSTAAPYSKASPNPNCDTTMQGNKTGKTAYPENEAMYRMNTGDLVNDLTANLRFSNVTGFFPTSVAGLTASSAPLASANNGAINSNQADMSYSFDITAKPGLILHFAVINTDASGADSTAPADWLATDFAAAKTRGASKFFVFGHKAAFTYNYAAATAGTSVLPPSTNPGPGGLDANYTATTTNGVTTYATPNRDAFWSVVAKYNATYFCGHEHTVNVQQYADPTGANAGMPFQVLVGSGGSPFDDKLTGTCPACAEPTLTHPYDRYYAWALVSVHASGAVTLSVQGFNDQFGPVSDMPIYNVPGTTFAQTSLQ